MGPNIEEKRSIIDLASLLPGCHATGMEELLKAAMPPDEEMVDLIEKAFLAGQIDGESEDLAYNWLKVNHPSVH